MKKQKYQAKSSIKKGTIPDSELCFSFKYFDSADPQMCPPMFVENYTQTLMDRLKNLSSLTVKEFITRQDKSLRNHQHTWSETSRPNGFTHLQEQLQDYPGWQFQISSNKYGRVHGIIIGNVFFVIWLDQNHQLYQK